MPRLSHLPFRTSFTAQILRTPNLRFCSDGLLPFLFQLSTSSWLPNSLKTHIHFTDTYTIYPRLHHIRPTNIMTNVYSTTPPTLACKLLYDYLASKRLSICTSHLMYHTRCYAISSQARVRLSTTPRFFDDARDGVQVRNVRCESPIN
jgi:hypothetical protein